MVVRVLKHQIGFLTKSPLVICLHLHELVPMWDTLGFVQNHKVN